MKKTFIALLLASSCAMGVSLNDAACSIIDASDTNNTVSITETGNQSAYTMSFTVKANPFLTELYNAKQNGASTALATTGVFRTNSNGTTATIHMGIAIKQESSSQSSLYPTYSDDATNGTAANGMTNMSDSYGGTWTGTKNGIELTSVTAFSEYLTEWGYNETTKESNVESIVYSMSYSSGEAGTKNYFTVVLNDGTTYDFASTSDTAYKFSYQDTISLSVNKNLVDDAYVFTKVLTNTEVASIHSQLIPEPTTATLSLLALAGLAARRRRK